MLPTKFQFIRLRGFRGKIFSSETAWPNESKLGRKHPWKALYKDCSFSSDPLTNKAATGHASNLYKEPSIDASYQVSVH
jgi:hypothetical protein